VTKLAGVHVRSLFQAKKFAQSTVQHRKHFQEKRKTAPSRLTSATKSIQKQLTLLEFHSTKNGTSVITKDMVDYRLVKAHLESNNLSYYPFYPKFERPIKVDICHLPINTPAEGTAEGLVHLRFEVISVRQVSTTHWSSEGITLITLPLFLVTLSSTTKSQDLYKLSNLCHISIKVELYKSQNGLTQCYNCQKFGHVWANCKQPYCCLWFGGSHLHKDCPEKGNASSTPASCNCQLTEGEKAHPANYRGCRYSEEEMRKKLQGTPKKKTGKVFSFNLIKSSVSFATELQGHIDQKIH
jgi:hypothetical protein